ncbi:uncharacterized protein PV06_08042 [Exophiala oligosperma]|uniref:Major facilitator superfamily (MFS) profile domain-containing protein n=1 Tax=Exophiala oligosperma TaxID=215243 RepID=A0A0D2DCR1_9EURO|nr:uncharacterized protein PV06_08042 [Exophiala oligosperma]KIW40873.1 hypothetical protein PV06_08042 [Exophiala oligosperma]
MFSRKRPIYFFLLENTVIVFLEMFVNSIGMIFAGQYLNGICYGFYFVLVPSYAAKVVPYHLRNISIGSSNMALIGGNLLGQGMTAGTQSIETAWAYRAPFALQWFWVIEIDEILAMLEKTTRLEKENDKSSSYLECFKGMNLRRTEIAALPYAIQQGTSVFFGMVTYFLTLSGLRTDHAFLMGVDLLSSEVVSGLQLLFMLVGFLDLAPNYNSRPGIGWAQSVMIVIAYGVYMGTTGPSSWVIMSETSTTRLRTKTVGLGQVLCDILYVVAAIGLPHEINPDEANWRGKTAWLYGGFAFVGLVWAYFRLPETKGRTYKELDILFHLKVPMNKFKTQEVEVAIGLAQNEVGPTDVADKIDKSAAGDSEERRV